VRLHVAEAGAGPPLVLLHGWPQHWYEWRQVIPSLAEHYHVICPDLRGFGWSDVPAGGYDRESMARDILALLDEMGIERFRLVGHDWGGWIGFLICLCAPERVERYLAMNIVVPFSRPSVRAALNQWRFWYQWVLAAPLLGSASIWVLARRRGGALLRWAGATRRAWNDEERAIYLSQLEEPERRRASVRFYRVFQYRDMRWMMTGRYRRMRLRTPTLLLHGVEDHIVRPVHLTGEDRADDMSVELVADCGHFIVDERPGLVLDRALAFFADDGAGTASEPFTERGGGRCWR
jgi:pimeloyl-ACP methyl ester carboxylesterase